jgi:peptidyl-prolyl cis-trans isomerase D
MSNSISKTIVKIASLVLIGLLVIAFAAWGVGDMFRGRVGTSVASVGRGEIGEETFRREFQNRVNQMAQMTGGAFDSQQARTLGFDREILVRMVNRLALDESARNLGLTVPDETIAQDIRNDPTFRGAFGQFDPAYFKQILNSNGITERTYVEGIRADLTRGQLVDGISAGVAAPVGLADLVYKFQNEQRIADYILVAPEYAGDIGEPTEEDLFAYHAADQATFTAPEYRRFTYILLTLEDVAKAIIVSDDALREEFDYRQSEFGTPEKREVEQILFDDKEAGQGYLQAALTAGYTPDDIDLGEVVKSELDPSISEIAFSLAKGEVSAPIEGPFGWSLLRIVAISESNKKTFEQVKDQLRDDFALDEARVRINEFYEKIEDERASGATLEEAAAAAQIEATAIAASDPSGAAPDGQTIEAIASQPKLLQQVFTSEINQDNLLEDTPEGGLFVARVDDVTPSAIKPLSDVRDEVSEKWKASKKTENMQSFVQGLADRINAGETLADIGRELDRAPTKTPPIPRFGSNETFSRSVTDQVFAAKVGDVVVGPVGLGESYLLTQLSEVVEPTIDASNEAVTELRLRLSQSISNELASEYIAGVKEDLGVQLHQTNINRALGDAL